MKDLVICKMVLLGLCFNVVQAFQINELMDLSQHNIELSVALFDEQDAMDWHEAKRICREKQMKLPSIDELTELFCHSELKTSKDRLCANRGASQTIPNFSVNDHYWSDSVYNNEIAQSLNTFMGQYKTQKKQTKLRVRCVQALP